MTCHRTYGVRYFHGCYSMGNDTLWGFNRRKGYANTLAALKSIGAARPDGASIYVVVDNLFAHKGEKIRRPPGRAPPRYRNLTNTGAKLNQPGPAMCGSGFRRVPHRRAARLTATRRYFPRV
ncbi:hypothetical protein [Streptomyces sp. JV185]|uniref:hypothetical protein n=1 Tax=Streptomyces sp. JV185 TaxID=858638 RepID=UPI003FA75380